MKYLFVSMALILAICQYIVGQDTLSNQKTKSTIKSPHNFSSSLLLNDNAGSTNVETQICQSCHEPNQNEKIVKDSVLTNIKQSKSFSDMVGNYLFTACPMCKKVNAPDGISLSCLYCHDGSIAQDRLARKPGITAGNGEINLLNSHPISFVYDNSMNEELWPMTHAFNDTNTVKDLLDENNEVQCTSCHNMHNTEFEYFLKINNEKSQLCLVCHKR